jgi:hypothetical protein
VELDKPGVRGCPPLRQHFVCDEGCRGAPPLLFKKKIENPKEITRNAEAPVRGVWRIGKKRKMKTEKTSVASGGAGVSPAYPMRAFSFPVLRV